MTWAIFFNLAADRYSRDFGSVFSCLRRASIVILAHCFYTYGEPLNNVILGISFFSVAIPLKNKHMSYLPILCRTTDARFLLLVTLLLHFIQSAEM